MIDLKKCNYFTGEKDSVDAVSSIVKFLELDNINYLLVIPSKDTNSTSIRYSLNNQFIFDDFNDFEKILQNKSNLFRVNLLVFDFWHLSLAEILQYKFEIDKTNINHIILAKEYYYKSSDDVSDYHLRREYKNTNFLSNGELFRSEVYIRDNINKWTSTLRDLKTAYVRDRKIDDLFGDIDI